MELLFLGTSSMVPTKERNHSSILLSYGAENILMDCGEGTQRQLKLAGVASPRITKVLISHWHGDHVLGLPGLLQTISASEYSKVLEIYGPRGTKKHLEYIKKAFFFEEKFEVKVKEIEKGGVFFENEDFTLEALPLEHTVPCLGYRLSEKQKRKIKVDVIKKIGLPEGPLLGNLQEGKEVKWKGKTVKADDVTYIKEGKSVAFILDTLMCENCIALAKNADVLVCEATYADELEQKANEYKHLTAKQAALIANQANVKQLIITHFSPRYKNPEKLAEEARDYFDSTLCAKDFMKTRI
jgi:ribonuclease Z